MSINLASVVIDFIREKGGLGLGLTYDANPPAWPTSQLDDKIPTILYKGTRCRAAIWSEHVAIFDIKPERNWTALGDRRCDLFASAPDFFEQLERHLLIENASEEVFSAT